MTRLELPLVGREDSDKADDPERYMLVGLFFGNRLLLSLLWTRPRDAKEMLRRLRGRDFIVCAARRWERPDEAEGEGVTRRCDRSILQPWWPRRCVPLSNNELLIAFWKTH